MARCVARSRRSNFGARSRFKSKLRRFGMIVRGASAGWREGGSEAQAVAINAAPCERLAHRRNQRSGRGGLSRGSDGRGQRRRRRSGLTKGRVLRAVVAEAQDGLGRGRRRHNVSVHQRLMLADDRSPAEVSCAALACALQHCLQQRSYALAPCEHAWVAYETCVRDKAALPIKGAAPAAAHEGRDSVPR